LELTVNRLEQRRLSDLVNKGDGRGPDVFFADPAAVDAAVADGRDPQLYSAARDVLPRRVTKAGSAAGSWSADLVVYQDGTLPGGEPFRSTGHWNPADQLEIFQVLSGRVLLLSCLLGEFGDQPNVLFQECRAGDMAVVPFGAWHLTYVLDGPSMVFNIYSGPATAGGNGTRPSGAHTAAEKYRSRRGPAEIAVTRSGTGYSFALSPKWLRTCGEPTRVSSPAWLRSHVAPNGMLADLHVSGSDADLEALFASARSASDVG
jgi:hypothetical protein